MPTPVVAGNWKMNTTLDEAARLASEVKDGLPSGAGCEVILCPPFVSLQAVANAVSGSAVKVGTQNMHFEASGAFTGEVSPAMLQGLCEFVILGHSERRQLFGETDEIINLKVKSAFAHSLRPILCVGETLEQREAGQAGAVVTRQAQAGLAGIDDITGLLVAYEPVWAIGTGQAATPEIAAEIMGGPVLDALSALFGDDSSEVPLLYGGSVNPGNAASFAAQTSVHGALVGGASLQAEQFLQVVEAIAEAKGQAN